jgi:predicted Zn finger-like uncharacterized protein
MRPIVKISCPACSAKYSIADDKVQERLAKIRCRKCGATIVIDGKTSPPNVYTAAGEGGEVSAGAAEVAREYSVDFGEGDQRTMPLRDLVRAYSEGQITGETYVWADGFADWTPLSEVPELMSAIGSASRAPAAPAPSPWDARPTARTSQLPRAAATTRANPERPAADLFGGVSRAGNEDDVATSAPEQPSHGGSGSSTGTRNESSVLFSLSALTSAAQNQRPSARPSAAGNNSSRDDSGLIDLKALTAAAVKSDTGAMAMPAVPAVAPLASPLGVAAPFGVSPLGAGVAGGADYGYPQKKSKTPIIIAALLSVGLLAVAAAIVLRPPPPPPPAPVAATPPPPPAPAPTPEPIAAAAPATGTAEPGPAPDASAKAPATAAKGRPLARRSSTSSSTKKSDDTKSSSTATTAAPAKKSSNCGCGPADLQCAMRCASKKQ